MGLFKPLVLLAIVMAPLCVSAMLYIVTKRWYVAFPCSAGVLPALVLVSVLVTSPKEHREWPVLMAMALFWSVPAGAVGTALSAGISRVVKKTGTVGIRGQ